MKSQLVKIGLCSLNNDPLDFLANTERILESIRICKDKGCSLRVGSELEICGYGCNDHFAQQQTEVHCWEMLARILESNLVTDRLICQVGCPVLHRGALYNCRIVLSEGKIVAIRPKTILADGDNYFETRHFAPWRDKREIDEYLLPQRLQKLTGQKTVPIGVFLLQFNDTAVAYEICEEGWVSNNPGIDAALDGAQIFINPSASYSQRGKLKRKIQMLSEFTQRHGGAYLYCNSKGVVGDRTWFDGGCIVTENGQLKQLSELFNPEEVQVDVVVVNISAIRTFRLSNKSFLKQTHNVARIPRVKIDQELALCHDKFQHNAEETERIRSCRAAYQFPHATYQPSIFLWEILRKSQASGFFLALSGGLDSCAVSLIVYNMCQLLMKHKQSPTVMKDIRRIINDPNYDFPSPSDLCSRIFHTCYLGTSNSSQETKSRAKLIASTICSQHHEINFDELYKQGQQMGTKLTGKPLLYRSQGGSWKTDLALQNIQARMRMVLSYFVAQLASTSKFLLVLGSSNLDESLRGYFTKYDCSSADYNPIASFSKNRLRELLKWNEVKHPLFKFIGQVMTATPTAELQPLAQGVPAQSDEEDMGLTYSDLELLGRLRKQLRLGPLSTFQHLLTLGSYQSATIAGQKVKKFYKFYSINRHKATTLPPGFHYDSESCDDNRFDMRPISYKTDWSYQFNAIDRRVAEEIKEQMPK